MRFSPDFQDISPLVSQANLARLRQTCRLDGKVLPSTLPNSEPHALSVSSTTSGLAQQEREFQKAAQPSSPISSLLSLARQPLMVAPAGSAASSDAGTGTFSVSSTGDSGVRDAAFWLCNSFIDHSSSRLSNPSPGLSSSAVSCSLFPTLFLRATAGDRAASFTTYNLRSRVGSLRTLAQGERRVRVRTRETLPGIPLSLFLSYVTSLTWIRSLSSLALVKSGHGDLLTRGGRWRQRVI